MGSEPLTDVWEQDGFRPSGVGAELNSGVFLGGTTSLISLRLCVRVDFGAVEPVCEVRRLLGVEPLLSDDAGILSPSHRLFFFPPDAADKNKNHGSSNDAKFQCVKESK